MRVVTPSFPLPVMAPVAYRTVTGVSTEINRAPRPDDRVSVPSRLASTESSISWARMSFDVDLSSSSMRVTLSDGGSGEVYRELIYDRGGLVHLPDQPATSQRIDRSV